MTPSIDHDARSPIHLLRRLAPHPRSAPMIKNYFHRVALAHKLAVLKKWYLAGPTVPSWDDFREALAEAGTALVHILSFILLLVLLIASPVWWPVWAVVRAVFGPLVCAYLNTEKDITDCIERHIRKK